MDISNVLFSENGNAKEAPTGASFAFSREENALSFRKEDYFLLGQGSAPK